MFSYDSVVDLLGDAFPNMGDDAGRNPKKKKKIKNKEGELSNR